jgi:alpha-methylacyl-CoA racemase
MAANLWNDEQDKPIKHLRVIDLTILLTGPYVSRMLAQYGADVVKVEMLPDGDLMRMLPNSAIFDLLNQGKKSIGLDLKQAEGKNVLKKLVAEADIFIENSRDGVMEKLGISYGDLSEVNPDLLYVSLRGFSGKNAAYAGHDLNFIATSGCGEWFLETGIPNYSTFFGDVVGGALMPLQKILFHLANPTRRGMHLISYMDEGFRMLYLSRAFDSVYSEKLSEQERSLFGAHRYFDGRNPCSRFYKCRDNFWISLQAVTEKHWALFCEIVDRKDWLSRREDAALVPEMEKLFADAPATYWESLATSRDVCLFRIIPWAEHLTNSQVRAQLVRDPFTWVGMAPNPALCSSPELGRDTFAVANSIGLSNKEISELISSGAMKGSASKS